MNLRTALTTAAILIATLLLMILVFPYLRRADYSVRSESLVEQQIRAMVKPECLVGSPDKP